MSLEHTTVLTDSPAPRCATPGATLPRSGHSTVDGVTEVVAADVQGSCADIDLLAHDRVSAPARPVSTTGACTCGDGSVQALAVAVAVDAASPSLAAHPPRRAPEEGKIAHRNLHSIMALARPPQAEQVPRRPPWSRS